MPSPVDLRTWWWDPATVDEAALAPAELFCALACLRYDDQDAPPRRERARQLLASDRSLTQHSIHAAAAAADLSAVTAQLARHPELATRKAGPWNWEPLAHLAYSRALSGVDEGQVLAVAQALLQAGADPNAGVLWRGVASPFTVLTGVLGEGEQGVRRQPRHDHWLALATLLLQAGADPNDAQGLYNRMFSRDNAHLELLFDHGLGTGEGGPWAERLGETAQSPTALLTHQVRWAVKRGMVDRLDLLADHGVEVTAADREAGRRHAGVTDPDRTPLHDAAFDGDLGAIAALLAAGADPQARDGRFDATPLGWAEHAYQDQAAALLRPVTRAQD